LIEQAERIECITNLVFKRPGVTYLLCDRLQILLVMLLFIYTILYIYMKNPLPLQMGILMMAKWLYPLELGR